MDKRKKELFQNQTSAEQAPAEAAPTQKPAAAPVQSTPRARKTAAAAKSAAPSAKT